jgi:hypothetical protein
MAARPDAWWKSWGSLLAEDAERHERDERGERDSQKQD